MSPFHRVPRLAPTVFLTCGLLATPLCLEAQGSPPSEGQEHGIRPQGRGRGFDPIVFEGPPKPEAMAQIATLDEGQQSHYAMIYANLMSDTKVDRDSLAALRAARRAEQGQDGSARSGDRRSMGGMGELRSSLEEKQRGFDGALKDFLTREQWKRYEAWCDQRRNEARERMRGMRDHSPGQGGAPQSP